MVAETGLLQHRKEAEEMTREELAKIADQLETSLVRATEAKKDIDLIVVLRGTLEIAKDKLRDTEKNGKKTQV